MPTDTLAARLKSLREAGGLTQAALAEASGVPLSTLVQIEQGARPNPQCGTVQALALALGVPGGPLLDGVAFPKKEKRRSR